MYYLVIIILSYFLFNYYDINMNFIENNSLFIKLITPRQSKKSLVKHFKLT